MQGEHDPHMAPPDLGWHRRYVEVSHKASDMFQELWDDPRREGAEDLGDWVETIMTLLTFRPRTRDDIEREVQEGLYPREGGEA